MVGKQGGGGIGPLLGFGSFEEETFLAVTLANASSRLQCLPQDKDNHLEASSCSNRRIPVSVAPLLGVDRRELTGSY